MSRYCNVNELLGKVLKRISNDQYEITFETTDGEIYRMYHEQDCCEHVRVEDVIGDFDDLIGEPILLAEEATNLFDVIRTLDHYVSDDSHTWTFYKFATRKGYVDIRWLGESNGYYSESVSFVKVEQ